MSWLLLVTGLALGVALGLTGAGGAMLAVPLLVVFGGLSHVAASGSALAAVGAAAAVGVWLRRHQPIAWVPGLLLAASGSATVTGGRILGAMSPPWLVSVLFCVLALWTAQRLWRSAVQAESGDWHEGGTVKQPVCRADIPLPRLPCLIRLLGAGALAGVLAGLFGVGGGFLLVPSLLLLTNLAMPAAVATSLLVVAIISLNGFVQYVLLASPPLAQWLPLALGAVFGVALGTRWQALFSAAQLQKLLVLTMVPLSLLALWRNLNLG